MESESKTWVEYIKYKIQRYMKTNNMSINEFAVHAGLNVKTIRNIVNVKKLNYRLNTFDKIMDATGTSDMYMGYEMMFFWGMAENPDDPSYKHLFELFESLPNKEKGIFLKAFAERLNSI